jgi:hypothetical protein
MSCNFLRDLSKDFSVFDVLELDVKEHRYMKGSLGNLPIRSRY